MGAIPPRHAKRVLECVVDIVMSHPKMAEMSFGEIVKEAVCLVSYSKLKLTNIRISPPRLYICGVQPAELSETPFLPVLLVKSLQSDNAEMQATTVVGVCKLFLCGIWFNDEASRQPPSPIPFTDGHVNHFRLWKH